MKDISITENHPVKKRIILGPLGRLVLKLINWDIVGDLPDNKKIIIASAPHSSSFDSVYAFFVCLASDLKFYFLGSISMFTRIVVPIPFKKNPDKLGIPHPFGLIQKKIMINFGGIPVWRTKSTGVTQQVIEELKTKDKFTSGKDRDIMSLGSKYPSGKKMTNGDLSISITSSLLIDNA